MQEAIKLSDEMGISIRTDKDLVSFLEHDKERIKSSSEIDFVSNMMISNQDISDTNLFI